MKNPFIPHILPIQNLDYSKLIKLVSEANSSLSKYNGILSHLINPSLLLTTFATQEAVLSSRIEGTQASFEEVMKSDFQDWSLELKEIWWEYLKGKEKVPLGELEIDFEKKIKFLQKQDKGKILDIEEIENCKKALEYGVEDLKNRPICLNLIKEIHSILLNSVRGHNADRGNFRKIQNFIGFAGATIEQATYIPPSPDKMIIALDNWEKYIHLESEEILIQLAIVHAQFEIIHPFLDGNGRIGRILIPLFLYAKNYLSFPAFYMSEYLESCRSEYCARLKNISENNDWQCWVEFFLRGIIEQSKISENRVNKVLKLYDKIKYIIPKIINSKHLPQIMDIIFAKPILEAKCIIQKIPKINQSTAIRILNKLSEHLVYELKDNYNINLFESKQYKTIEKSKIAYTILKKHPGQGSKPSFYEFTELLNILKN